MFDRRMFLKSSGLSLIAGGLLPNVFVRMAEAGTVSGSGAQKRVLVAIFQRGAVDGLNVLIPYAEKAYYAARPSIAVPRPGSGERGRAQPGRLLRPASVACAAAPLLPGPLGRLRARGRLARLDALPLRRAGLHGVGHARPQIHAQRLPDARAGLRPERQGLAAARRRDDPGHAAHPGGLRRHRDDQPLRVRHPRRPVQPADLRVVRNDVRGRRRRHAPGDRAGILRSGAPGPLHGSGPHSRRPTAPSIRAGRLATRCARSPSSSRRTWGWRSPSPTSAAGTRTPRRAAATASSPTACATSRQAIAAFSRDLGSRMADVTLVTMSEFGRTVKENGNRGTDHGHANVMLLLGGGVAGGKVYGKWPGLDASHLYENRDLAVTTDFRDVFAEVLARADGREVARARVPGLRLRREQAAGPDRLMQVDDCDRRAGGSSADPRVRPLRQSPPLRERARAPPAGARALRRAGDARNAQLGARTAISARPPGTARRADARRRRRRIRRRRTATPWRFRRRPPNPEARSSSTAPGGPWRDPGVRFGRPLPRRASARTTSGRRARTAAANRRASRPRSAPARHRRRSGTPSAPLARSTAAMRGRSGKTAHSAPTSSGVIARGAPPAAGCT